VRGRIESDAPLAARQAVTEPLGDERVSELVARNGEDEDDHPLDHPLDLLRPDPAYVAKSIQLSSASHYGGSVRH